MLRLPLVICRSEANAPAGYEKIFASLQTPLPAACPCCVGRSAIIHTLNALYLAWVKGERLTQGVALIATEVDALTAELSADVLTAARWTIM